MSNELEMNIMKPKWLWIGVLVGVIAFFCLICEVQGDTKNDNYIIVTFPSGGETFYCGDSIEIRWEGSDSGSDDAVNIKIYINGGGENTIQSSTKDDRSCSWKIPSHQKDSDKYQIKVTDKENSTDYDISDYFSIYKKKIVVGTPNAGEKWYTEKNYTIMWESTGASNYVDIDLYKSSESSNNLNKAYTIAKGTANDGNHIWTISSSISNSNYYKIEITDSSQGSLDDYSDNFFTIIELPKKIIITSPNGGEKWIIENKYTITWNSTGYCNYVNIDLYRSYKVYTIAKGAPNDGNHTWTIPSSINQRYEYKIRITDQDDSKVYDVSDNLFSINENHEKTEGENLINTNIITILICLLIVIVGVLVSKSKEKSKFKKPSQKASKRKSIPTKTSQKPSSKILPAIESSISDVKISKQQKQAPPHTQKKGSEKSLTPISYQKPLFLPPILPKDENTIKTTFQEVSPELISSTSLIPPPPPKSITLICKYCGAEISDQYKFCSKCGKSL